MELSELQFWNGKLLAFDDRTGIIYEIISISDGYKVLPRYVLSEGDGNSSEKGFKNEWATVKDGNLYVGSIGKEWTTPNGKIINYNPMYIKIIDANGNIRHVDWREKYEALRKVTGTTYPGYMVHEAVSWSPIHRKWFFLPRRMHNEMYDEKDELNRGANTLLIADEEFKNIEHKTIGKLAPTRGFSSMKFVPGRSHEIIALKTEELGEQMVSYVMVFDWMTREILLPETKIDSEKFEGIEIFGKSIA